MAGTITGMELLQNALAIAGKEPTETDDFEAAALIHINTLLADLFDTNNTILENAEEEVIDEIPVLALAAEEDLTDVTIPYEDQLTRNCMSYGLARLLILNEQHPSIGFISNMYEEQKVRYSQFTDSDVTDYYDEEE